MADPAPPQARPRLLGERRFFWPGGLSARLLMLTIIVVVVANVLIVPADLAVNEEQWLTDRLRAGELASLIEGVAPNGVVTDSMTRQLADSAGVVTVAISED